MRITDIITRQNNWENYCHAMTGLEEAFDTIWQDVLLYKMLLVEIPVELPSYFHRWKLKLNAKVPDNQF